MKVVGNTLPADNMVARKMQNNVVCVFFFSPNFIDDNLITKAECVKDVYIWPKYLHGGLWEFNWYFHPNLKVEYTTVNSQLPVADSVADC